MGQPWENPGNLEKALDLGTALEPELALKMWIALDRRSLEARTREPAGLVAHAPFAMLVRLVCVRRTE